MNGQVWVCAPKKEGEGITPIYPKCFDPDATWSGRWGWLITAFPGDGALGQGLLETARREWRSWDGWD